MKKLVGEREKGTGGGLKKGTTQRWHSMDKFRKRCLAAWSTRRNKKISRRAGRKRKIEYACAGPAKSTKKSQTEESQR